MNYIIFFIRIIIYTPLMFFQIFNIFFKNKFILLDLDYSLCNNFALNEIENYEDSSPDYENLEIPINEEVLKFLNEEKCNGYSIIIFTSRGLRSSFYTKAWLNKNNINFQAILYLGVTLLKTIPIFLLTFLSKDFILIDDLCDIKNKELTRSFAHKYVRNLQKKNNFLWIDTQNKFFNENF